MRLPNPYSLEETLEKLRYGLAVAKAHDDEAYAKQFEETLLQGSTVEIRECLSCFGDYVERSRDTPPYYPYHDAVNGIDCALYAILFETAYPNGRLEGRSLTTTVAEPVRTREPWNSKPEPKPGASAVGRSWCRLRTP
ncbi:hypothetical protein [Aeromonas veronii]|uniref:hypothetical protein n=1 Tax=Aeromonas veronii TaxID=654 RepID=UPI000390B8F0|nr:hypothetical protein [Aeromonas veronii]